MVQKRPFDAAEEMLEVSFKHPKHAGSSDILVPLSDSVIPDDDCYTHLPKTSEEGYAQGSSDCKEKLAGESCDGLPRGAANSEPRYPVIRIPASSWTTSRPTEEDHHSEPPIHLPLFPEYFSPERPIYFSPERPIRTFTRYEDLYSILLEHSPRKPVCVGADHQAEVPPWGFSGTTVWDEDEAEKRLMGTCIIPMPDMELPSFDDEVGKGRTDCSCDDRGSMRCVRQHIMEERKKLLKTFGIEKFIGLGFAGMGEQVAEKWSPEDEHLFHKVIFNNPASLNKNFWNYLSIVFPSRTKKEIVSYYFNVFMLRKRAEQNRNHLLNADSDNDEWQGSDDNEIGNHDEDEDSVAEYPIYQDDNNCNDNHMEDYDDEFAEDETCDVNGIADHTKSNIDDDSKYDHVEMHHSSSPPLNQPEDQSVWQDSCDEKVKHDPYTSHDMGVASREIKVKSGNGDNWCSNYNGLSNGYSQGYVLEPCDAPGWDSGFVSCSKNKIDFLPTCSMIEEVFGDGRRQDMRRA
ncbi:AT-rich interactive domain-containing protein [Trifolium repens]|nr:AT-rich interactive domain-containing protein [Trifolium repens]